MTRKKLPVAALCVIHLARPRWLSNARLARCLQNRLVKFAVEAFQFGCGSLARHRGLYPASQHPPQISPCRVIPVGVLLFGRCDMVFSTRDFGDLRSALVGRI
jgi:hypothetical protein